MTDLTTPAEAWTAVADAWETHVDYVDEHSEVATKDLLARIDLQPGDRVLELASGPGTLGASLSTLVGPEGTVVLSDLAPGMVAAARRRTASLANVTVAEIDASAIDRPDHSFDAVACRMGLQFTSDPSVALAEIVRVLAPGGRIGALTWGGLEHNPWLTCVGMAGMLNGLVTGGPPVGPGTVFGLSDPAQLEALAKGAGLVDVQVKEIDTLFRVSDIDTHVARVSSLAGGALAQGFANATAEQLAGARATAAQLAEPHQTEVGYAIPGRLLLLSAHV
ncbi:MAG: methyltransferase domain-containing protein [Acidimicrobiales bacterium]